VDVLVVEDAPALRRWLVDRIAEAAPSAALCDAGNGADAARLVRDHDPAVVVLDLGLPEDADDPLPDTAVGLRLLEALCRRRPRPVVAVVSSFSLGSEAMRLGADAFIAKRPSTLWVDLRRFLSAALKLDPG